MHTVRDLPVVDLPAEKKRRTYLANAALAAGSHRGHAMIVRYTGETFTRKHHHPNAESLFVVLTGKVQFLVDGKDRVLGPGEAAFFPTGNSHGLKSADGNELSFLEFHVPGAFTTQATTNSAPPLLVQRFGSGPSPWRTEGRRRPGS